MVSIANIFQAMTYLFTIFDKFECRHCFHVIFRCQLLKIEYYVKVEYHANAKYENLLKNSEQIACVGQWLLYPITENKYLTKLYFFLNAI